MGEGSAKHTVSAQSVVPVMLYVWTVASVAAEAEEVEGDPTSLRPNSIASRFTMVVVEKLGLTLP